MSARWYAFVCGLARIIMGLLFPLRGEGLENVPAEGGALLCCNHISLRDPIAVACVVRRPVRFMAKAELFKHKWSAAFMTRIGAFPVKRGEADMGALRAAISIIKEGGAMGIFPQGHRDASGEMPMETGVALIALRTGAPVIPARLIGPYRLFRKTTIVIGKPLDLSMFGGKYDGEQLKAVTGRIEAAVRGLKPAQTSAGD